MYSLVMVMALAGSADVQGCHRNGGCNTAPTCGCYGGGYGGAVSYGCTGYGASTGCYGGGVSYGCFGGGYGGCFGGGHGCHGGLFARRSHGCFGGGYGGCYGGGYGGCYGGGYVGGVGCYGGMGGYGGGVIVPGQGTPPQKLDVPPAKKLPGEVSTPATIVVTLPADAKLVIDGYVSQQTSTERTLVTIPIQQGQEFTYTLVAQTTQNGQPVSQTQRVTVRSGQQLPVRFDFTATPVSASR